jgi:hypothetical protein
MRHVEFRTMPAVVKLLEVLQNPRLSLEDIAEVVSKDQILTARLRKQPIRLSSVHPQGGTIHKRFSSSALTPQAFLLGASFFRHDRNGGAWAPRSELPL